MHTAWVLWTRLFPSRLPSHFTFVVHRLFDFFFGFSVDFLEQRLSFLIAQQPLSFHLEVILVRIVNFAVNFA